MGDPDFFLAASAKISAFSALKYCFNAETAEKDGEAAKASHTHSSHYCLSSLILSTSIFFTASSSFIMR